MLLALLGRVIGILMLVIAVTLAIAALFGRSPGAGALSILIGGAAFALSLAGSRRGKGLRAARELAQAQAMAAFRESALTVHVRWAKLVSAILVGTAVAVGMILMAWFAWDKGEVLKPLLFGPVGLIGVWSVAASIQFAAIALNAGHMIHLDMLGLAYCALPQIPWRHVHGIDLEAVEIRGGKNWFLKLGLDRQFMTSIRPSLPQRWFGSGMARFDMKLQVLTIPLAYADFRPDGVLAAARFIADRSGAPRVSDWSYLEEVPAAITRAAARKRLQEAQDESERLLARLKSLRGQPAARSEELRNITAKLAASTEEIGLASAQELEAVKARIGRQEKQARRAKRPLYLMLGVIMVVGLLQFTLK